MIILSPSLLSVDFAHIADGIAELDRAKVPALHLDVMDGAFVPNISFHKVSQKRDEHDI